MLNRRLAALAAVACLVLSFAPATIFGQSDQSLPAGVLNVEIDGQAINATSVPLTNSATPEISGRVDLGVPTIELVVSDGDEVRFTAELDNRGRFRAAVLQALADGQYSLTLNDLPIGAFAVEAAAEVSARQPTAGLLDIARVVPYPADFGDVLTGIGFLDGRFVTLEEEATRTAAANGEPTAEIVRETRRKLAGAGWLQRYESRLAVPVPDDPDMFAAQFSSFAVEYGSTADARAAFETLNAADPLTEFPIIGDESSLALLTGTTPDTGAQYQAARLVFRAGSILGTLVYADLQGQQPDLGLLASVAQQVAARAVVVIDRETVPLGAMALRLDPAAASGRVSRRDLYDVRAGTLTALYNESQATVEDRIRLFTGTTDAFSATTNGTFTLEGGGQRSRQRDTANPTPTSVIAIEGEPADQSVAATPPALDEQPAAETTAQVAMRSALFAFPGKNEADDWLALQHERLLTETPTEPASFSEDAAAPAFGESSVTFSVQGTSGPDGQETAGYRIYSRVGDVVALLELQSVSELPLDFAAKLMQRQVECIEAQECSGLVSPSGKVTDGSIAEDADADAPVQITEPTRPPVEQPTPAPPPPTQVPVVEPTPIPIEEPVEEPTPIPIEEPTEIPVEVPTAVPVEEATPPVEEATPPAGEEPTAVPAEEPTAVPGDEPTAVPVEEPTQAPVEEPTAVPVEEPTAVPTPGPVIVEDDNGGSGGRDNRDDNDRKRDRDKKKDKN